jgi:autotransporter-associated beta strand protein/T5SS/PEP-CTERM-associated repeat protein
VGDGDFGVNPVGVLDMNGGTLNIINGELWLGEGHQNQVGGTGTMYMRGGAVTIGNWFAIGRFGGIGDLEMTGGSITKLASPGGNITIATTPSTGIINQSGGVITNTATQTWVAESAQGTWNLNGGAAVLGVVHLTQNPGAQGAFNLNGGDLTATEITDNGGVGSFNFNGGTLHAGGDSVNFFHDVAGSVLLQSGGAIIDTEGHDVTMSQMLNDGDTPGTLTKKGAGTLTLSGQNFYTGQTLVNAGTLAVTTDTLASGAYSVADNAGFKVIPTYQGAQMYPASLTLGSASAGAALSFDLGAYGNPPVAPLAIAGNLTLNGPITINVADAAPVLGEFPLLSYGGSKLGSGSFVLGDLPPGVVASLVPTASGLDLNVTGVALDIWSGVTSSTWDIGTSISWVNAGNSNPTVYSDGDQVKLDDTATGSTTVNLAATVVPGGTVSFDNSLLDYTVTGTGAINGLNGLTKSGTSTVTLLTTNGYTGKTTLNGGTLIVSNLANGGLASAIGAATSDSNNLVFNGGTLNYGGPSMTLDRGFILKGNYGPNGTAGTNIPTLDIQNDLTLTGPVSAAPNSAFVKAGPGTLTYKQVGTNELSGGNNPGYQVYAGTLVFDGSAGPQVNHSQQEFWIGDTTNSGANIILTNTTLNVDSWFSLSRGNGDSGFVCNGNLYNSTLNCGNLSLGWQNGRPNLCSQFFTMTNSTIHDAGNFLIAESPGSVGTFTIAGNSVVACTGGNPMLMGLASGATGNVVVADNSIVTNNAWLSCGANGYGTLTLKNNARYVENGDFNFGDYGAAGTVGILNIQDNAYVLTTAGGTYIGKTAGAFGYVNQSSGILNARASGVFQLGQSVGSYGQYIQTGGTNYAGGWLSIGRGGDPSATGLYVISGGLLDQTGTGNGLIVGEQGSGTLTISNSALVVSEANDSGIGVAIGWNGGVGTLNLNGGTLVANYIQGGTGNSTFIFNGGLLQAGVNARFNFMTNLSIVYLYDSSVIDTVTNTIAINSAIYDGGTGGTLTKKGSGTLLLDGANNYSGATIAAAGSLGGVGSVMGPLTVQSGASLAPGDNGIGTFTAGTVTLASGSSTVMELNGTDKTSDQLAASTVTYGGTLVLKNLSGQLAANDTFTLFPTPGTGSFSSVQSITPGQAVTWDTTQLSVDGTVKVVSVTTTTPPNITTSVTTDAGGSSLTIAWPADNMGYTLQVQSNPANVGLSTNWVDVAGSSSTNKVVVPINPAAGSTFYRLVQ